MSDGCYSCAQEDTPDAPIRERLWLESGWRVAHSFNSSLPGWLVVLPTRHVETLPVLTVEESVGLGPLLRDLSRALVGVTGCSKTYVMLLVEAEGFSHLHFHLVPRAADMLESRRGVDVFSHLKEEPLSEMRRDEISQQLHEAMIELRRGETS